ncbi:Domain of uncharacterised function (DUF3560) [Mycobacteroides abscessus subsp. abscessus]|uniref:DUF3560 domain-containing protein n=1 Tax=Mycobacteroides abscessus TaxID=36809 RepID=UPI000925C7E0|nr:DUF3560 domain-containing protein [Mycobacteroides abscessus]SIC63767.1 Domain of uncharacterised function (DUF3560) [Mycobacteroides abscessus subsp. abscessus]SIC95755.1 Domain of uncharacterised function (DUF3560) [Mycobacteroides abscessus subsp. abscessus]SID20492.1 Domain of uncharacterised function (DUF3560) [Mycobacteroides abscessus subsp. abscessus]SID50149.1 Domain of uncharacterised function (DUF3560) [Mycobacteroides abscessus subsp. abscessus]SKV12945.1 Domain of uncharacteris
MTIKISHSHLEGTLVSGIRRGDGTYEILKANGFRWFRSLGQMGLTNSRDRAPRQYSIDSAAAALRAAGHTVTVEIDNTYRPAHEVQADRNARQQDRANALAAKAQRRHGAAESAWAAEQRAHDALPPAGEPIKVGHHSENRHRRAIERSWDKLGKAVQAQDLADETQRRADVAASTTAQRYSVHQVANRLEKLRAEQRADERARDGHTRTVSRSHNIIAHTPPATGQHLETLRARIAARADEIAYWESIRDQHLTDGQAVAYGPENIAKGDEVEYRGLWYQVLRVNKKSVTVPSMMIEGYTHTIAYHRIGEHRPASTREADKS